MEAQGRHQLVQERSPASPPKSVEPAPPPALSATFTFATQNSKRGAVEWQPVGDDGTPRPPIGHVINWQECKTAAIRDALRDALPEYDHETFNRNDNGPGMNSISWRRDLFRLVDSDWKQACEGRLNVSPARFVCWAILEHVTTGIRFADINCHFTPVVAGHEDWCRQQWGRNLTVLRQVIASFRIQGLPILLGGDLNRQQWDIVGEGLIEPRYVMPPAGPTVDRIAVSKDVQVEASRLGPQNGSDHFSVIARLTIKE